jgi:Tol biopolymer transport system component
MKRVLLILFVTVIQVFAQNVTVVEDAAVTNLKEGTFYYPALSPDGTSLIFSSVGYKGLWSKNLVSGKIQKITDASGAGYEPGFGSVNSEIIYREDKFVNGKRFSSLISYDMSTKKSVVLEDGVRDLKICRDNSNTFKSFVKGTEVLTTQKQKLLQKSTTPERIVFIDDSKMVLSENNSKKNLQPFGKGYYIWASLSPDKTKLLFTCAGKGTFISDLEGTVLKKIGYANYPSWSPDGNWVLFMKDLDDGVNIISSDIFIANLNSGQYFNLTLKREDISLYPRWGKSNAEIFYNTDNGQIRKIKLIYE